jgi:catechol 2,3-dioxygenase
MYTIALDLHALLDLVADEEPARFAAPGLVMGHMHLHVGDIQRAVAFYSDVLGFEVMVDMPSASFLAAGGYHHHLGLNTWRGEGVGPAPRLSAGLREWHVVVPSDEDVAAVRRRVEAAGLPLAERESGFAVDDPWETTVVVSHAA